MALTQHTAYAFSTDRASIMRKHPENTTTWNKSSAPSTTSNPPTAHKVRQWPEGTKAPSAAWKGTLPNRVYFHLFFFFPHLHSVLFFTLKTVKMFRTTPKPLIKTEGKKGVPNLTKPSPALLSALLLSTAVKQTYLLSHPYDLLPTEVAVRLVSGLPLVSSRKLSMPDGISMDLLLVQSSCSGK